jgi:hypothetical protein
MQVTILLAVRVIAMAAPPKNKKNNLRCVVSIDRTPPPGVLSPAALGVMEYWSDGVMERWSDGAMDEWSI